MGNEQPTALKRGERSGMVPERSDQHLGES